MAGDDYVVKMGCGRKKGASLELSKNSDELGGRCVGGESRCVESERVVCGDGVIMEEVTPKSLQEESCPGDDGGLGEQKQKQTFAESIVIEQKLEIS